MPAGARAWIDPPAVTVDPQVAQAAGGHSLAAEILTRRGICSAAAARAFLDPDAYTPAPPEDLPGMEAACGRIERAIQAHEAVCVWGDFDVDGQTSTTLLVATLRSLGARVTYHIPVRAVESHGVHVATLAPILDAGVSLLLTCDTGITAHDAVDYANLRGADVIITDHHALPERLPAALACVNPNLLAPDHPLATLPGVGVAYQVALALLQRAGRAEAAAELLDLVALGIVADLAHQTADTRWLLQRGLAALRETRRPGLLAMFDLAGLNPTSLTEEHIGFVLGPRLNALGRLDDANPAVELLTSADPARARALATHLEGLNAHRRLLTAQVLQGALAQIERSPRLAEEAVLVLAHPGWPAGVIGIVASELVERFHRPVILLAAAEAEGQPARGSARSIPGVNITEAIASQKALLLGFGGHPMAAGLSLDVANLPAFRRGVCRYVEKHFGAIAARPPLQIDAALPLGDLTIDLAEALERLAPFGPGNPPITLAVPGLRVSNARAIGRDGSHLQVTVQDDIGETQRVLWWGAGGALQGKPAGAAEDADDAIAEAKPAPGRTLPEGRFDLACSIRASDYRGTRSLQVEWVDARPVEEHAAVLQQARAVEDLRGLAHPLPALRQIVEDAVRQETAGGLPAPLLVWAEGEARERLAGAGIACAPRDGLHPATVLVIWTTPCGRPELDAVLEAVAPQKVVLFAVDPETGTAPAPAFLQRLAGLAKFALGKRAGRVTLDQLCGASAQREAAVRLGLQALAARGLFRCAYLPGGEIQLEPAAPNPSADITPLLAQIQVVLAETAAYRRFFQSAGAQRVL